MMLALLAQISPSLLQVSPFFVTEDRGRYAILYELQIHKGINIAYTISACHKTCIKFSGKQ
jgi:hypothetical protein